MEDQYLEDLEDAAEHYDEEVEDLKEKYWENREEIEGNELAMMGMDEEDVHQKALQGVTSGLIADTRTSGNIKEIPILAVGFQGIQTWNDADSEDPEAEKKVLIANGLVKPPADEDDEEEYPLGRATFIIDETEEGVDPFDAKDKFRCLNTLKGEFSIRDGETFDEDYVCTARGPIQEAEVEDIPSEKTDILRLFHDQFDRVTMEDIGSNLTTFSEFERDDGSIGQSTADWGMDLKYMDASIVGMYVDFEKDFGIYNLIDDTVMDVDELVGTEFDNDEGRTPSLTAWTDPDQVELGEGSLAEFYGIVERDDEGQITMNVVGIVPKLTKEIDNPRFKPDEVEEETF